MPGPDTRRGSIQTPIEVVVSACAVVLAATVLLVAQSYPRTDDQREWNRPFEPFRIIGNLHYVGTADLGSYLLTSDAGHVLLDTGLEEQATQLIASIDRLGFKVEDIELMINSQAHFDHAAGLAEMKRRSGARLLASDQDARVLESGGRNDFAFGDDLQFPPVKVDGLVRDGQVVEVGPIKLTPRLTPGHTKGTTTWLTTVREVGREHLVVFAGSTSINPGVRVHDNPTYPEIKTDFDRTYALLKSLEPEVFLGQHAGYYGLADKYARLRKGESPNPFIDPAGYHAVIARLEAAYRKHP